MTYPNDELDHHRPPTTFSLRSARNGGRNGQVPRSPPTLRALPPGLPAREERRGGAPAAPRGKAGAPDRPPPPVGEGLVFLRGGRPGRGWPAPGPPARGRGRRRRVHSRAQGTVGVIHRHAG